jgi:GNAT superfamily N-acetyltransferase
VTGPRLLGTDRRDLLGALPDDLLLRQLANRWDPSLPAYVLGGAVSLFHRWGDEPDVVVVGDDGDAYELARFVARSLKPWVSLPAAAGRRLLDEGWSPEEGWAFRWITEAPPVTGDAAWLRDDDEVRALLDVAFPHASMPVGHPDVHRWAGVRRDGRLVAVAADATQTPGLGFLASIATLPEARGTGAGTAVTAFATAELVREHGACGLWHMAGNASAIAVYDRLGYRDEHHMAVVGATAS